LEVIVTLLALLEMVKQLRVTMQQDQLFGDIQIVRRGNGQAETAAGPAANETGSPASAEQAPQAN
jgi:chromatin segregation and condensation protein Rec8/ScpA/Scc1 (kleisin family)